ncbi:MAG: V-type ATP synthase subunit I [Phycisphaerae bacterium]|nr:V-type ATP synthase subunit I [Phycisphaerae bacterium]
MAIAQMQKVMIVSHRSEAASLLDALQASGICQVLNAEQAIVSKEFPELHVESQKPRETEELVNRLANALTFLKDFAKSTTSLLAPKMVIEKSSYESIVADKSLLAVLDQSQNVQSAIDKLQNDIENYNGTIETLEPWKDLSGPVEELKGLTRAASVTGLIPAQKFDQVSKQAAEFGAAIEKVSKSSSGIACLIVCLNENLTDLQKILRAAEFEAMNFESMTGTVSQIIEDNKEKLTQAHKELAEQFEKTKQLAQKYSSLQILFDHYSNLLDREVTKNTAPATEQTVVLEGWAKRKDYRRLEKVVSEFSATSLAKIEPAEGEMPPIEIANNKAVTPFETITRLYGLPSNIDVDPTVFLAPFFALFFGICLTDAGYGILLIAVSWWLLRKFQGDKKIIWMFFICSAITIAAGAMTGGWFGDAFQTLIPQKYEGLYNGVNQFRTKLMLTDPMENPMVFFGVSLGLGYLQIMVGILIAFFNNLRQKEYATAIFEHATWFIFLNSLILFGLSKAERIPVGLSTFFGWLSISQAVLIFLFTERKSGIGGRIGGGVFALFSTVFYFGDLLSYARLMALGMVTGGLGMAINILVKLLMDMPNPIIGYILGALLFVSGHLFNIAMSVLSSFVHSLRLQFVEFFPKFFVGGGKEFEPLKKNYKHIMVK